MPSRYAWKRPGVITGRGALQISTESINAIEEAIRWATFYVPSQVEMHMDTLVRWMAYINQGIAQEMSYGPYDPQQRTKSLAWKVPVRRVSQKYFYGWKTRRLTVGVWQLYNDSREAFFIEFGIHRNPITGQVSPNRIRRPVRKISLRRTLEAMMRTHAYHRIWSDIYYSPRYKNARGFSQTIQSPGMGSFTGPLLGRRLP